MLQKNYTNPLDRGRYGFSRSGKFNSPYKFETPLISIAIAAGIVGAVLVLFLGFKFVRANPTGLDSGRLLEALVGVFFVLGALVILGIAGFAVKVITQGYPCRFIADEEKFMLEYGGSHHTIYYSEVQNVHFMPRSFFGKVRGYTVTLKINGADEEYAITSDGYLSESATPFYLIKERVEMLRQEEEAGRAASPVVPLGSEPLKPVQREDVSLADRVSSLLGKDAEMPGISAATRPDLVAANNAKKDPVIPDIAAKLSPTVNGYADDMPAVDANGKVIGTAPSYTDEDGRDRSVRDIIAAGTFREVMKPGRALLIGAIGIVVYMFIFGFMYLLGIKISERSMNFFGGVNPLAPLVTVQILVIVAFPFYAGTVINFMKNGDVYTFKANGREFVTTNRAKKEERILYADVQDVVYKKMEFLWFIKGYHVEILTRYGVTKYNYVCEGRHLPDTSALPFEVIRKHISK